jgi:hypothetical protein
MSFKEMPREYLSAQRNLIEVATGLAVICQALSAVLYGRRRGHRNSRSYLESAGNHRRSLARPADAIRFMASDEETDAAGAAVGGVRSSVDA